MFFVPISLHVVALEAVEALVIAEVEEAAEADLAIVVAAGEASAVAVVATVADGAAVEVAEVAVAVLLAEHRRLWSSSRTVSRVSSSPAAATRTSS